MAAITRIWVDDDRLYVETDDGGDPQQYIIEPDQHYIAVLDEDEARLPSASAVWIKPKDYS